MADLGRDLSCVSDLDPRCVEVTGNLLLAQAVARRLMTPRGRLLGDPNYGTDITGWINDDVSPADVAAMQAAVRAECEKDPRVSDVSVEVAAPPDNTGTFTITITLTAGDGPFDLVLAVSAVTVALLSVSL